ncbi:hypothetical protein CBR_g31189 [Chara braunii]|uniref:Uncharacterized protein n=1 Tax=Chara braunii TaxID=69332 RepID=A0A388JXM2_CHABU|nr:hypothetical protein CBR_g31189 [Chara braunii]|eukprot:GBG62550.1 hypothetical protein CBR_g31189 [Chara braunii]
MADEIPGQFSGSATSQDIQNNSLPPGSSTAFSRREQGENRIKSDETAEREGCTSEKQELVSLGGRGTGVGGLSSVQSSVGVSSASGVHTHVETHRGKQAGSREEGVVQDGFVTRSGGTTYAQVSGGGYFSELSADGIGGSRGDGAATGEEEVSVLGTRSLPHGTSKEGTPVLCVSLQAEAGASTHKLTMEGVGDAGVAGEATMLSRSWHLGMRWPSLGAPIVRSDGGEKKREAGQQGWYGLYESLGTSSSSFLSSLTPSLLAGVSTGAAGTSASALGRQRVLFVDSRCQVLEDETESLLLESELDELQMILSAPVPREFGLAQACHRCGRVKGEGGWFGGEGHETVPRSLRPSATQCSPEEAASTNDMADGNRKNSDVVCVCDQAEKRVWSAKEALTKSGEGMSAGNRDVTAHECSGDGKSESGRSCGGSCSSPTDGSSLKTSILSNPQIPTVVTATVVGALVGGAVGGPVGALVGAGVKVTVAVAAAAGAGVGTTIYNRYLSSGVV